MHDSKFALFLTVDHESHKCRHIARLNINPLTGIFSYNMNLNGQKWYFLHHYKNIKLNYIVGYYQYLVYQKICIKTFGLLGVRHLAESVKVTAIASKMPRSMDRRCKLQSISTTCSLI